MDLIEIGNSQSVVVEIYGDHFELNKELDEQSIKNLKKFSHEVILAQKSTYFKKEKRKRGFFGIGRGTGYQLMGGCYTNLLKGRLGNGITDFIAFAIGQSSFYYDKYKLTELSNYPVLFYEYRYYAHRVNKSNRLTSLLGLSYQKATWILSLELAVSLNYYFLKDEHWNRYIPFETEYGTFPYFINKAARGKLHQGFAIGAFMQAGPLWYHIDTKGVWIIGLSLPIKF